MVTVFSRSVVTAALGQAAAITALVPSLGLLVQQIIHAAVSGEPSRAAVPPAATDEGHAP
jgi:hypothetical protein